jgi:NADPH:quinone reductase-like Zn-dependent oxidoreductase
MRALVHSDYGGPEVLQHVEIEKPAAADNEILVKVHAASVNPADWHLMRGTPYLIRMGTGFRGRRRRNEWASIAGTIEA